MIEDRSVSVSSSVESSVVNDASQTRQRKKRKWDQRAESIAQVRMTVSGVLPFSSTGIAFSGGTPISSALLTNTLAASVQ